MRTENNININNIRAVQAGRAYHIPSGVKSKNTLNKHVSINITSEQVETYLASPSQQTQHQSPQSAHTQHTHRHTHAVTHTQSWTHTGHADRNTHSVCRRARSLTSVFLGLLQLSRTHRVLTLLNSLISISPHFSLITSDITVSTKAPLPKKNISSPEKQHKPSQKF